MVVIGLGKNLLLKSVLGHCVPKLRGGEYDKRKTDLRVTKFTKKVGENHVTMWPNSLWNRQFQSLKLSHLTRNLLNVLISQTKILENIS